MALRPTSARALKLDYTELRKRVEARPEWADLDRRRRELIEAEERIKQQRYPLSDQIDAIWVEEAEKMRAGQ